MSLHLTSVHTEVTTPRISLIPEQDQPVPSEPPNNPPPSPDAGLNYGESLRLHYPNEWQATKEAYEAVDDLDLGDRVDRLRSCRSYSWFARHKVTGMVKVISSACKLRWCPLCAQSRANFLGHSVRTWYHTVRNPKLLTLTIKHTTLPLKEQINFLYRSFTKLRRSALLKKRLNGGVWFFQIKWSKRTDAWHPHIHALLDSGYIPHAELRQRWSKITKGSDIVDIRACYSAGSAANHVARYATRPGTLNSVPESNRLELLQTLHGRRIVGSWGTAKSVPLSPPKSEDKDDWTFLGTWREVNEQQQTSMEARQILFAWKTGFTLSQHVYMDRPNFDELEKPWVKDSHQNEYYSQSLYPP